MVNTRHLILLNNIKLCEDHITYIVDDKISIKMNKFFFHAVYVLTTPKFDKKGLP